LEFRSGKKRKYGDRIGVRERQDPFISGMVACPLFSCLDTGDVAVMDH